MNTRTLVAFIVCLCFMALAAHAERTVKFGISVSLNATSQALMTRVGTQQHCKAGLIVWRDWFNGLPEAKRTITHNNVTEAIKVELVIMEDSFLNYTIYDNYREMFNRSDIDFLFAPCGTPESHGLVQLGYKTYGRQIMMGPLDSTEKWYGWPGAFGTAPSSVKILSSVLPYLRIANITEMTVVRSADAFAGEVCDGFIVNAKYHAITVKKVVYTPGNYFPVLGQNEKHVANMTAAVEDVVSTNNQGLLICDYVNAQHFYMESFRNRSWLPEVVIGAPAFGTALSDPTLSEYMITLSTFSERANYPAQPDFGDIVHYSNVVQQTTGTSPSSTTAQCTLAGMLYTNAILTANSVDQYDVARVMERLEFNSFLGVSSFDFYHRQLLAALVLQQVNGTNLVVGPSIAASSAIVIPIPRWDERVFVQRWGSAAEIAASVLIGLGCACSVFWIGIVVFYWNNKAIRAASPVFLLALLFGAIICYISIFTWMPGLVNDHVCRARAWLLPSGYIILYGSLIAKTFRIDRLNRAAGLKVISISDGKVAIIIGLLYAVQAIISILMVSVSDLRSYTEIVDIHRPAYNYNTCTFDTTMLVLMIINICYGGILMLWGSYLAYRVRTIPYSIYDESKVIVFSIYNTAFFAVLVIIVRLAFPQHLTELIFILTAVFTFFGGTVTTTVLFVSKLVYLKNRPSSSTDGRVATTLSISSRNEQQMESVFMHGSAASVFPRTVNEADDTDSSSSSSSSASEATYKSRYNDMKKKVKYLEKELAKAKAANEEGEAEANDDGSSTSE